MKSQIIANKINCGTKAQSSTICQCSYAETLPIPQHIFQKETSFQNGFKLLWVNNTPFNVVSIFNT